MDDVMKFLDESSARLLHISDLIKENYNGDSVYMEISKLYDIAKEMDDVKHQCEVQKSAITACKTSFSQANEPWHCQILQIFEEHIEKENQKNSKIKQDFQNSLKKHVNKKEGLADNEDIQEIEESDTQAIDPWTKQPIKHPMKSKTCNHLYDKRSITCIIRNRKKFKCPYVGCQQLVQQADLIDVE